MVGKLAHLLARWHTSLKIGMCLACQVEKLVCLWHIGTFIGTLAHKNEMLARFWYVGT